MIHIHFAKSIDHKYTYLIEVHNKKLKENAQILTRTVDFYIFYYLALYRHVSRSVRTSETSTHVRC